jgi:hypothetical protein
VILNPGDEVFLDVGDILERVKVLYEVDVPRHPYLATLPNSKRKVAVTRTSTRATEIVLFSDLRFAD